MGLGRGADDWAVTRADDVDLVLVLTPNDSHAEISIDALARGKHVLCEKPLSNTLEGARDVSRRRAAGGCIQVGFVYRKWPAVAFARQIIEGGGIGEIVHYRGHFFHDYGLDPALPITWRLNKAISGGGSGADIGSHVIDMARYLAGEIRGVCALAHHFTAAVARTPGETAAVDVDEITDMLVEFEACSTRSDQLARRRPRDGHRLCGARHQGLGGVHLRGADRGRLYKTSDPRPSGFRSIPVGPAHPGAELFWPVPGMALGFGDGFIIAVRDLLRAIADGRSADPISLDGLRASEVVAAAQASAATRSWRSSGWLPGARAR